MAEDMWTRAVDVWCRENDKGYVQLADVLLHGIGLDARHTNRSHELRVANILRSLGYVKKVKVDKGRRFKAWELDPLI